jgi:hydrogenase nickel incorporation protein HypA/HybF
VVREALEFAFEVSVAGSAIDGARLAIEEMPVTVFCPDCGGEPKPASAQMLVCPECGEPTPAVVGGRELELYALEVEENVPAHR